MNKDFENLIRKIVKEEKVPGVSVTKKAQDGSKKETDAYYKEVTKKMGDYDRNLKQDDDFTPPKRDLTDDERDFHDEVELGRGMEHLRYDNEPNETFKKRQEDAIKGSKKMGNETENGDKDPVWGGSVEDFGQKLIDRIKTFAKKEEDATQTYVQFGDDIELSDKEPMIKKKKMAVESVNESETISNMELYKDRRKQGDSPEDAALFLLDVITTGTYASKSEDEIKGYVDHIIDIYEKKGDVNEDDSNQTEYNTKTDALNGYFKGEISAEELDNIAKDKFNSEIATKEELDDFISNQFLQDMMSDTHNISKDVLIEKVKELLSFMGSVNESNEDRNELRSVKVTFGNGDVIKTNMASDLTDEEIKDYYKIGRTFNIGAGNRRNLQKVVDVEILDTPKVENITEEGDENTNQTEDQYGGKTEEIKSEIETIENVDGQTPTVSVNDKGLITVSGEDGKMFAEYYGTESKPWPYIDEALEELAEKYNTYWEWENPSSITLEPFFMNESKKQNKEKDDAYDKFFMRKMKEFNVDSPEDLTKDQWEEIDSQWLSDDETIKITESITNNKKSNKKQKTKMKRLKFKREFKSVEDALNLIPESYKVDDKEFVMTDGNQNLRVRWEGNKDGNASVLEMSDDKHLKESVDKMFHLMNYNPADAQAKGNDPENLDENEIFSKLYSDSKKGVLSESEEEEGIDETKVPEDTDMYEKIKEAMGVEALCDAMVLAMDTDTFKSIMEYIVRTQEITLDEGIGDWLKKKAGLKDNPEEVEARKEKLMSYLNKAKEKGWETFQYDSEKVDEETLVSKMEKNGFTGKFVPVPKRGILVYKPGAYGAGRLGSGGASQGLGV